jgi:hypothetical protein
VAAPDLTGRSPTIGRGALPFRDVGTRRYGLGAGRARVLLFADTPTELAAIRDRVHERLALLPRRVRAVGEVDDDF